MKTSLKEARTEPSIVFSNRSSDLRNIV